VHRIALSSLLLHRLIRQFPLETQLRDALPVHSHVKERYNGTSNWTAKKKILKNQMLLKTQFYLDSVEHRGSTMASMTLTRISDIKKTRRMAPFPTTRTTPLRSLKPHPRLISPLPDPPTTVVDSITGHPHRHLRLHSRFPLFDLHLAVAVVTFVLLMRSRLLPKTAKAARVTAVLHRRARDHPAVFWDRDLATQTGFPMLDLEEDERAVRCQRRSRVTLRMTATTAMRSAMATIKSETQAGLEVVGEVMTRSSGVTCRPEV